MTDACDDNEREICDGTLEFCNSFGMRVGKLRRTGALEHASRLLWTRTVDGFASVRVLRFNAPHDWGRDGNVLLRVIYDATLQLAWMLDNPEERDDRCERFLDYLWIEKHKFRKRFDLRQTDATRQVAASPFRNEGEKQQNSKLLQIGPKFLTKSGRTEIDSMSKPERDAYLVSPRAKYQQNWYGGANLRELACAAGLESEYEILHPLASGDVHVSPMSLMTRPTISARRLTTWASLLVARACRSYVDAFEIVLSEAEKDWFEVAKENFFNSYAVRGQCNGDTET